MIDGSKKRNRQLAFELQNSHVCEKRSNVAELVVAYINLEVLNKNVPLNIFSTVAGIRQQTPLSRLCKRRETGTPETGNNACGWPVMSAFDIRYILVDILRCPHNEVKISQR